MVDRGAGTSQILLRVTLDASEPYSKAERILIKRMISKIKAIYLATRSEKTGIAVLAVVSVEEVQL